MTKTDTHEVKRNGFMPYEMAVNLVLQNFPHYTKTEARYQLDRVMNNTEIWRVPFYSHSTILLYHGCLLAGEFGIENSHHDENCDCEILLNGETQFVAIS
jgi:hypothetical protein|tara:strand:+ start:141 stop:440 length:300 start_codon:yes stop_codon:yes gene_type:complete